MSEKKYVNLDVVQLVVEDERACASISLKAMRM
jgi:hypothetical protein